LRRRPGTGLVARRRAGRSNSGRRRPPGLRLAAHGLRRLVPRPSQRLKGSFPMLSSNPAPTITAAELAALLGTSRQPLLVDVRTEAEHREWSIPGSVNIPLDALHKHLDALPRDTPFVVHCASGIRSRQAVEALRGAGRPALDLAGGMKAWARVYDTAEIAAGPVTIVQVRRRGKGCLSYLVGAGGEAFAVDPSTDTARYIEIARRY